MFNKLKQKELVEETGNFSTNTPHRLHYSQTVYIPVVQPFFKARATFTKKKNSGKLTNPGGIFHRPGVLTTPLKLSPREYFADQGG